MTETKYTYLVASDLDGTLLASSDSVSEENVAAIAEFKRRGICFAPCSGRCIGAIPKCLLENPDIRYYIGADGTSIWDKQEDKYINFDMKRPQAVALLDLIAEYKGVLLINYKGKCYVDANKHDADILRSYRMSELFIKYVHYYAQPVVDFDKFFRSVDGIDMVCVYFAEDAELDECCDRINKMGGYKITSSEQYNIEVFSEKAGKGNGMLALADALGIPHENTVAVGDSENDLDMLSKAGLSLAMENAADIVKQTAHRTICHYKEHSAKYILELLTGK